MQDKTPSCTNSAGTVLSPNIQEYVLVAAFHGPTRSTLQPPAIHDM